MIAVTFHPEGGAPATAHARAGDRLLDVAQAAGMALEGACGGALACATCHVVLAAADYARFPPPTPDEEGMLDFAPGVRRGSRLSCQLLLPTDLAALTVSVPAI